MPRPSRNIVSATHRERLCVLMTCEDGAEAAQVAEQVLKVNTGSLVTYREAEDVLTNQPAGRVVLIILSACGSAEDLGRQLAWMRHRWPNCPITVIGDEGGGPTELAARRGGASYLTRPVGPQEWGALVGHVLRKPHRATMEVT